MTTRTEAAAKAMEHHAGVFQVGHCADHHHEDSFECVAQFALAAADAVMFSEAAVERAARALHEQFLLEWEDLPRALVNGIIERKAQG